ncbi:hypothetical protein TVAG_474990 [Trichomonas vaginalis G3]|uniref:Uncharacterized protein n=1 Tax=Trichomonas vaginalis (strain ATCC PRA-98 / G3) TaxID=412133 RepID=A2ERP9_TRIV3|nr:hypothetical protein TVAGG3_0344700 [Trichomonas vaginalis G3]EAY04701.1 hypothetical protein TVAG_474990 [Trichomonas vaginalis G3]KAI5530888.1 hypothetical protein TVAGG3_0344700 [Trichomonas vaginalis G3]|eukprot:XP_001316924.1 hypothetical protein [Trichomonas vaginalis G3]
MKGPTIICDGQFASLLLAKFDTNRQACTTTIQKELANRNTLFYNAVYANHTSNLEIQQKVHKYNVLLRKYLVFASKSARSPKNLQETLRLLDFVSGKILYDNQMAKQTKEELSRLVNQLNPK